MIVKRNFNSKIESCSKYDNIFKLSTQDIDFSQLSNSKTLGFTKTAKVVEIAPQEKDFIYIRNRAVSAGNVIEHNDNGKKTYELVPIDQYYANFAKYSKLCRNANTNGDFFSHEELQNVYKTFIGKSVFVDHNNQKVEEARGIILDAVYNENGYFVELLEAIDKKAFPQLADAIIKRYITGTSMGCRCGKAKCSICGNIATTEKELCEHVLNYKGLNYNGLPVFEDNYDVEFFEDSIVCDPADPTAVILERVASKQNRSGSIIPKYYKKITKNPIATEKNQRSFEGRVDTIQNQLNNLWD